MKHDLTGRQSITVKRTVKLLTDTLTELLEKEPFEKITVMDICEKSMIPRATFYNYFEDKYDLLNYYWTERKLVITPPENGDENNVEVYMLKVLENLIHYLQDHINTSKNIYEYNSNGQFQISLHNYLLKNIQNVIERVPLQDKKKNIPASLEAEILTNCAIAVGYWWISHNGETSMENIQEYLKILINQEIR